LEFVNANSLTMIKEKLLFLGLLVCVQGAAQQKFIEVTAEDSILARADCFVYRIMLTPDMEEMERDTLRYSNYTLYTQKADLLKQSVARYFDSLKLALRQRGFTFIQAAVTDSFNIVQAPGFASVYVLLHSVDSLSQLHQLLQHQKKLTSLLMAVFARDESAYQKMLYKKLLDAATVKAKNIAAYTHQKIGGILSVTENKTEEEKSTRGWTSYAPLSAISDMVLSYAVKPGDLVLNSDPRLPSLYPIKASFTVRFSTE